ncbi:DUF4037 domain-containing protein [Brachybacterium saurashtrense]|uniref:DUF4037 domain-containing protein n=1 Tax=Brachybacterium saurashtrense TaxID=556288 RepID=A0A345YMP7_9MICO|nr:DUF4037 domain-containing protein [Brachybacterium saurashtrense]AXK45199.1 DUF4037 domain-containing protein [Brachybacterium saurashtrense]RRR22047.1 DUF4037 domain-containing protein [Brachybacterium saurashtrense]
MTSASGLELSADYHSEVVAPLLERRLPGLPHAAARLGSGSDVLGFDDAQSRDHDWGLRLTLLVEEEGAADEVDALLERELPASWRGLPTRFATTWEPVVRQRVEVARAADFAASRVGIAPGRLAADAPLDLADWLQLTGQAALEVTAGPVFHDGTGALTAIRARLAQYPEDVRRYALGADWTRIGQELPDVGRAGLRGDEDGSAVIAARHVRTLLHLAHLLHRRWAPYGKWLARSAAALPGGQGLREAALAVLRARDWRTRQRALGTAIARAAAAQGRVGLPTLEPAVEPFFDRPHLGLRGLPELLAEGITDPEVRALTPGIGTAEQISDHVSVLVDPVLRRRLVGG